MAFERRKCLQLAIAAALAATLTAALLVTPSSSSQRAGSAADCGAPACGAAPAVTFRQGPYFNHPLPSGWEIVEESNSTLLLRSRDRSAHIGVAGMGGIKLQLTPEVFAFQRMTALGFSAVRYTSAVYIIPMAAYDGAAVMDVTYTAPTGRMRGLVVSNVATIYNRNVFDRTDGTMTLVGATEDMWEGYTGWLPEPALQAVHTGPNPFATPSRDLGSPDQRVTAHREWAKRTWDELVTYRAKTKG